MALQPRSTDEIYNTIRNVLVTRIAKITNFVSGSFNDAFVTAYSEQIREAEIKALASEFAGTVDYAGKELTVSDLERENVTGVDPEEINEYMEDRHLDNLAANYGVERFPGSRATGTVDLELATTDSTVSEGFEVATQPDSSSNIDRYYVDVDGDGSINPETTDPVSPESGTTITVDIIAADVGTQYNTGAGTVTYIPNPKPGIQASTNVESLQNGEDVQPNDSLREDVRTALFDSSGGGTESGLTGYVENNASTQVTVGGVEEFTDQSPPFVDVVVDGGDDPEIRDLIQESKPLGIRHNLVRPSIIKMGSMSYVVGNDLTPTNIRDTITGFLDSLGAGDSFYWSSLLQRVMDVDRNIESVPALNMYINVISQDRREYDSAVSVYSLDYGPIGDVYGEDHLVDPNSKSYELAFDQVDTATVGVSIISNDDQRDLDGTEFTLEDATGNGNIGTLTLGSGVEPDVGTTITVDYQHSSGFFTSIEALDGTEYVRGTDYDTLDSNGDGTIDSIEWLSGTTPADGERFEMQYTPYRSIDGDMAADNRERFGTDSGEIDIRTRLE